MISVIGWLFLERMEGVLTTNLRHELQHTPVLIRSNQQVVQGEEDKQNEEAQQVVQDEEDKNSSSQKPFAYVFYVTSDTYACAAIQFIDRLTTKLEMNSTSIDVVVMHTRGIGGSFLNKMQGLHVRTIEVDSIHADASERTWKESLTKLRVFQDWGYSRVVFFDADAVPMVNLDHLFDLPPATLYAPTAYWLEQPFFASTMLVIEPSEKVFNDIVKWARDRGAAAGFDMDILNSYFKDSVHYLPGTYTILNSDFRRAPSEQSKLFNTTTELKKHTKVVHFSCKPNGEYGKPWNWPTHDLSLLDGKGFDPLFGELFKEYWRGEEEQCSG
ncbi:Glucose N-acetyltransferase 1 [Phytophthora citrophthora]|uniref:Glucose N-acetyltransferase 1 n=1 Tax=Phytophthora citrophthora TaxID=4793 RepID=A0AAD9G304_9STRA|nr:Glucose N-acetyltransferase 1 [Phytophthora citrophthora]